MSENAYQSGVKVGGRSGPSVRPEGRARVFLLLEYTSRYIDTILYMYCSVL